jgi:hypothetical protein
MDGYKVKSANRDRKVAVRRAAWPLDNRRSIQTIVAVIGKRASQPVKRGKR